MDLQKSISKAKQMRGFVLAKEAQTSHAAALPDNGDSWMPPIYNRSRSVTLDTNKLTRNRVLTDTADLAQIESYKILRAQVLHRTREKGWRTIMVTSPYPGEGKTLTTINLGVTFAKEFNQTVLMVDGDLRRQKMHQYLGLQSDSGLVDHLIDNRPLSELIVWPGIEKLTLISGGKCIRDSSEYLGSPKMKSVVQEMKKRYEDRFILFDVPPILTGADTIAFAPYVDCILMVIQADRTTRQDIRNSLALIPEEKFMGFILNRYNNRNQTYYY